MAATSAMTPIDSRDGAPLRGRWLCLRWSQSLAGQPVRLVVRLVRETETEEHATSAAILGRGAWTWRAPRDLKRLDVLAPDDSAGAIRIDELASPSHPSILLRLLRRRPTALPVVLWPGTSERGRNVTVHEAFDLAPLGEFDRYARDRRRAFEPDGLDANLVAQAARGPRIGFVLAVADVAELGPLSQTLAAFTAQRDLAFHLLVLAPPPLAGSLARANLDDRLRIASLPEGRSIESATLSEAGGLAVDYVARLMPGDEPVAEAVLCLRAFLADRPGLDVLYADSARQTPHGLIAEPKPDWSPTFQAHLDYVGRPCLVRRTRLAEAGAWRDLPGAIAAKGDARAIGHLKRILATLVPTEAALDMPPVALAPSPPRATIVVPTRDRVELLRRLCESLFARTPPGWDLVVVDNGSEDEAALAYLAQLEARADTRVLRRPGPFNFSALVNAGVEAAEGEVVLLLNNDCEIIESDWLARLAGWAIQPGIGAVGARLLYADGTLQHAGVALGLGGEAGHRDRKMPRDHPGTLGRLTVPHEVAAVTAACLAVRRETYLAVGGFDEGFPVAFNDIDFCLRLRARGNRNLLDPGAVVAHAESASRGRDDGPRRARFLREAALFRERWGDVIRDDPYFHPMLTTVRFYDRLG